VRGSSPGRKRRTQKAADSVSKALTFDFTGHHGWILLFSGETMLAVYRYSVDFPWRGNGQTIKLF